MQHALRTRQWNSLKNADSTNVKNSVPTKHKATQDDSTKDGPPRPKRAALGEITEALSSTLIDSSKKTNVAQSQEVKIETATTVRLAPLAEHEYTEKLEIADESAFDFDEENSGDPYAVSDFVRDIFQYYKHREAKFQVGDYFRTKTFFTNELRAKLVNWLIEVQETFELNHETLYLAVKLMDMYFARVTKLEKSAVLLVACTAIFVASKMEERQVPGIDDLIHMTRLQEPSSRYTTRLMKAMERDFLRTVGYDLGAPLSYSFLRRYSRVTGMGMASLTQARFFLEQSLHFLDFCRVSDSRLAAAALLLALRVTDSGDWNSTLEKCSGYKLEDVEPLMWCLNHMSRRFSAVLPRARTVLEKYSHKVFYEVAKMPLLRDSRGERSARKPSIEVPPELQFKV
ncbi:G2/mitotic-specific cyclin-B3 [Aphelenchoides besseyi]|nr:G2/mitotic-specific cyclin-B3 [Aphelenchoides besseyi]